jgi:hypothetical protein
VFAPKAVSVPKLPVSEFDRIPKGADTLAAQLVFRQLFFEQKVFLCIEMYYQTKYTKKFENYQAALLLCYPTFFITVCTCLKSR